MSFNNTRVFRKPVGITPRYPVKMVPNKYGCLTHVLEGETQRMFRKLWPIHSNRRIAEWFGLSFSTIQRLAKREGLEKNMKAIRKELSRDVKKICEANGYYASLRGKRPSEACLEASRRKRAEGYHPCKRMKELSPRRYAKFIAERGAHIHELREKEKKRLRWGLEQKTKLNVAVEPLPHRAAGQKHLMIKHNNYFAVSGHSSWVCYDNETRRSARREATAIRHGLQVRPADDYIEPEQTN